MSQISGLTVRHHAREGFGLAVEFIIAPRDRTQVRFSKMSGSRGEHIVRGIATDISSGGLGWVSAQFIPRSCEGCLRVLRPGIQLDDQAGPEDVLFETQVKVRRVVMEGNAPEYAIGVAFIDPPEDVDQRVEQLTALAHGNGGQRDA